jgi:hypothetical protein
MLIKDSQLQDTQEKNESKSYGQEDTSSWFSAITDSLLFRQVARTATREITRGLLGAIGLRAPVKRSKNRRRY